MAKGFFITGTDTGVGKTIVAAALLKVSQFLGYRTIGMKPIESGCLRGATGSDLASREGEILIPQDGRFIGEIAGAPDALDLITPLRFENPLAPLPASDIEGKPVDLDKVMNAFAILARTHDVVIVEGIGGIMVPIRDDYLVSDLAKNLGLPVIVVAKPGLGTLNHTLLTLEHALAKGLSVAGIIINYSRPPEMSIAERTNQAVLEKICPLPVVGILSYMGTLDGTTIRQTALRDLNLEILKTYLS